MALSEGNNKSNQQHALGYVNSNPTTNNSALITPICNHVHPSDSKNRSHYYRRLFHENKNNSRREAMKESLRKACLNRARHNRRDILKRRRGESITAINTLAMHDENSIMRDRNNVLVQEQVEAVDAQKVVEQELRYRGIGVVSPCLLEGSRGVASLRTTASFCIEEEGRGGVAFYMSDSQLTNSPPRSIPARQPELYLNEEELYDLMQEVEGEIHRSEELLLEEVLEEEKNQQLLLEQQIAEYQEWEKSTCHNYHEPSFDFGDTEDSAEEDIVLCPLCNDAALVRMATTTPSSTKVAIEQTTLGQSCCNIICPLHKMNGGSCTFQLKAKNNNLSLSSLRENLALVYQEHSYSYCGGNLVFELVQIQAREIGHHYQHDDHNFNDKAEASTNTKSPNLVATCPDCNWSSVVI